MCRSAQERHTGWRRGVTGVCCFIKDVVWPVSPKDVRASMKVLGSIKSERRASCTGSARFWSRRDFLWRLGGGLSAVALVDLLRAEEKLIDVNLPASPATSARIAQPHYRAKASRVIQLFMSCGVSQVDSFDYKPALDKVDGQEVGKIAGVENLFFGKPGRWMKSPFY